MNRGSRGSHEKDDGAGNPFNEAPIHESGKSRSAFSLKSWCMYLQ